MARTATIFRLKLELSDVDREIYESLDFRVAQHPSEGEERLVARILAYALLYAPGLEFGKGLSDVEEPTLWEKDLTGQILHWIDVGTPGADRLHIASKKSPRVSVVCHRGEEALARETSKRQVHRAEDIRVCYLDPTFIQELAQRLERTAEWTVVHNAGELSVSLGDDTFTCSVIWSALPQ